MPGIAYYLSRWYRRSELAFRLSLYIVMAPLAGAFGGLLASGILMLDHFGSLRSWRMIFAIEGIVTIGIALISFFTLTDRPETAKWLSQEEKDLAIARVKSERVGATEVLDKFDVAKTLRGIFSPVTIVIGVMFMLDNITVQGLGFFAPTIVKTIYPDATVVAQQLHTVPPYVVGAFFTVLFPYLSWRFDHRLIFFIICPPLMMTGKSQLLEQPWLQNQGLQGIPGSRLTITGNVIGYIMFLASEASMVRYGATFIIACGAFSFGSLCPAIASANVISDTARSSAIGTTVMFGNIGGLISTWSFLPFDGPNYPIGNGLNFATSTVILLLGASLWAYIIWENRRRARVDVHSALAGLSPQQIQDLDWRNPGFRLRP